MNVLTMSLEEIVKSLMEELGKKPQDQKEPRRRRLPVELECEIFKCLKLPIQFKFIWGMGRGVYGMFGQRLILRKSKMLCNPNENGWDASNPETEITPDGLKITRGHFQHILAKKGFTISGQDLRSDHFPGTMLYYYEVTHMGRSSLNGTFIGLSDGSIFPNGVFPAIGIVPNSFAIASGRYCCFLSRKKQPFVWHDDAIKPQWQGRDDVVGCGLVLSPANKLAIFFTLNGQLMGKQIPINLTASVDYLFPTVRNACGSLEANFGDNPAKPFKYDIEKCPGLVFEL